MTEIFLRNDFARLRATEVIQLTTIETRSLAAYLNKYSNHSKSISMLNCFCCRRVLGVHVDQMHLGQQKGVNQT